MRPGVPHDGALISAYFPGCFAPSTSPQFIRIDIGKSDGQGLACKGAATFLVGAWTAVSGAPILDSVVWGDSERLGGVAWRSDNCWGNHEG